jgi:hypothetical protein
VKKMAARIYREKGEATLSQCFSHTAGYPDYQPKGEAVDIYQTLKESVAPYSKPSCRYISWNQI